jgi:hypothetical protein
LAGNPEGRLIMRGICRPFLVCRFLPVQVLLLLGLLLALAPGKALAEGGKSIATAPSVVYGQQEVGNTATGKEYPGKGCGLFGEGTFRDEFWMLNMTAGDRLTINWGGVNETKLWLYDVGTTDYTVFNYETIATEQELNGNGKNQLQYTASVSGAMPLEFSICSYGGENESPGPYSFIAADQHALLAALMPVPIITQTSVLSGTVSLADGTPAPDGLLFHLVAKWHSGGQLVRAATSATTAAGALSFQLALPAETAGKTVRLSVSRAEDSSYLASRSTPLNVVVTGSPKRRRHHHHRHHRHRHHHHRH